jgi:hypothetical protein
MAYKKILFRRDTASNWTSQDPTLAGGEIGLESNTNKIKLGNGVSTWTELPYFYGSVDNVDLDDLQNVVINDLQTGDVIRWNGTSWINDPINLATDTVGSYVSSLVEGTGVTISGNSGEGATPTITIGQAVATSSSVSFARVETTGNVVVGGNLTVNGTTTTLNTDTLAVEDNLIVLNANVTGAPVLDAGIEIERGTSLNTSIRWNETDDKWEISENGTTYSPIVSQEALDYQLGLEHWHKPARLATDAVLPNSPTYTAGTLDYDSGYGIGATLESSSNALLVIDSTNAAQYDRILVKNQADAKHNGVYKVTQVGSISAHWILTRVDDMDGSSAAQITHGEIINIAAGVENVFQTFSLASFGSGANGAHVLGTDDIDYVQVTGVAQIIFGSGLTVEGNSVDLPGINATSSVGTTELAFVNNIELDAYGRVIGIETSDVEVTLGTNTVGDYVATITGGTGVSSTAATTGEGTTHTLSIGQDVQTSSSVNFARVYATDIEGSAISSASFGGAFFGQHTGTVIGNVTGDVTGNLLGNVTGDVTGNVTGLHIGNVTGNVTGNLNGNVSGSVSGNVTGNLTGNVTGDVAGMTTGLHVGDVTGNLTGNVTGSVDGSISGNAATVSSISTHALDALSDVSVAAPTTGQFLKWSGSAWVADAVDLGADTAGNYVSSINAGTGVSLTNGTAAEAGSPTINIGQSVGSADSPLFAGLLIGNTNLSVNGNLTYSSGTNLVTVNTLAAHDLYVGARITVSGANQEGYNGDFTVGQVTSATQFNYTPTLTPSSSISSGSPEVKFGGGITFEGSTPDEFETVITFVNPTADRVISLPNATTTLVGTNTTDTLTNKTITNPTITGVSPVITLAGDLSGSATLTDLGNATLTATIAANSVALGTDTSGSYVENLVAGTGVTITNNSGEGATPTISIGQSVGTGACVQFDTLVVTNLFATNQESTNSAELNVSDSKIVLNAGTVGLPTIDGSIVIDRGSSASVCIRWNETQDRWEATRDGSTYKIIDAGAKMTLGTEPPASPDAGDFWFETDSAITFVYYDGYWIEIGASGIGAVIGSSSPENPSNGQFWFKNTTNEVFVYYNGEWVLVSRSTSTDDVGIASIMGAF